MFESDRNDDFKNYLYETVDSRMDKNLLSNIDPMQYFNKIDLVSFWILI